MRFSCLWYSSPKCRSFRVWRCGECERRCHAPMRSSQRCFLADHRARRLAFAVMPTRFVGGRRSFTRAAAAAAAAAGRWRSRSPTPAGASGGLRQNGEEVRGRPPHNTQRQAATTRSRVAVASRTSSETRQLLGRLQRGGRLLEGLVPLNDPHRRRHWACPVLKEALAPPRVLIAAREGEGIASWLQERFHALQYDASAAETTPHDGDGWSPLRSRSGYLRGDEEGEGARSVSLETPPPLVSAFPLKATASHRVAKCRAALQEVLCEEERRLAKQQHVGPSRYEEPGGQEGSGTPPEADLKTPPCQVDLLTTSRTTAETTEQDRSAVVRPLTRGTPPLHPDVRLALELVVVMTNKESVQKQPSQYSSQHRNSEDTVSLTSTTSSTLPSVASSSSSAASTRSWCWSERREWSVKRRVSAFSLTTKQPREKFRKHRKNIIEAKSRDDVEQERVTTAAMQQHGFACQKPTFSNGKQELTREPSSSSPSMWGRRNDGGASGASDALLETNMEAEPHHRYVVDLFYLNVSLSYIAWWIRAQQEHKRCRLQYGADARAQLPGCHPLYQFTPTPPSASPLFPSSPSLLDAFPVPTLVHDGTHQRLGNVSSREATSCRWEASSASGLSTGNGVETSSRSREVLVSESSDAPAPWKDGASARRSFHENTQQKDVTSRIELRASAESARRALAQREHPRNEKDQSNMTAESGTTPSLPCSPSSTSLPPEFPLSLCGDVLEVFFQMPSTMQLAILEVRPSMDGEAADRPPPISTESSVRRLPTVREALLLGQHVLESPQGVLLLFMQHSAPHHSGNEDEEGEEDGSGWSGVEAPNRASTGTGVGQTALYRHPSRLASSPLHAASVLQYVQQRYHTVHAGRSLSGRRSFLLCYGGVTSSGFEGEMQSSALQQDLWPSFLMWKPNRMRNAWEDPRRSPKAESPSADRNPMQVFSHSPLPPPLGGGSGGTSPSSRRTRDGSMRSLLRDRAAFHRAQQRRTGRGVRGVAHPKHHRPAHSSSSVGEPEWGSRRRPGKGSSLRGSRWLPHFTRAAYKPESVTAAQKPHTSAVQGDQDADATSASETTQERASSWRDVMAARVLDDAAQRERLEKEEEAFFGVAFDMVMSQAYSKRRED